MRAVGALFLADPGRPRVRRTSGPAWQEAGEPLVEEVVAVARQLEVCALAETSVEDPLRLAGAGQQEAAEHGERRGTGHASKELAPLRVDPAESAGDQWVNAAQVVKPAQEGARATGGMIPAEAALEGAELKASGHQVLLYFPRAGTYIYI